MATAGLRTIEIVRADVGDIIHEFGKTYLLIQGKGHSAKDAKILLAAKVITLIHDYLSSRGSCEVTEALFTSTANRNRGQRLQPQTISKMVKAQLRAVGIDTPRLTAHSLRHTAATTMIYNNAVERMKNTAEQTAADSIFNSISA